MIKDRDAVTGMLNHALIVIICLNLASRRLQSQDTIDLLPFVLGFDCCLVLCLDDDHGGSASLTHSRILDISH